jgi:hypothetical protein
VAHLTIHWVYTDIGDDANGELFAKFREGLNKWTRRHGFDLTGVWARERMSGGQAEAVHCHLLLYLPPEYRVGVRLRQLEAAIYRLIKRHGRDYWAEQVAKIVIHPNPDGKYLIKGGGPKVWKNLISAESIAGCKGLSTASGVALHRILGPQREGGLMPRRSWHSAKGETSSYLGEGGYRYSVVFRGKLLVQRSRDPECDAARTLLAQGFTGKLTLLDGKTDTPGTMIDIEKAARLSTEEGPRGPRFVKYRKTVVDPSHTTGTKIA